MDTIEQQIITTLEKISPFLQRDGGDVDFVSYKDGVVYVRMKGACVGCSMLDETLSMGIEMILMEEVPGVVKVEVVE
jgi:Fe-S cluster biogenesis protein NfuA